MFKTSPSKSKSQTYTALEDEFDLANGVCVEGEQQTMWALLNSLGALKQFVYGFVWQPTHESQITVEGLKAMWAGIREVQPSEKLTFISESFRNDAERQQDLAVLAETAPEAETRFFIFGEQNRTEELTRTGVRKLKRFHIFFTYTVDPTIAQTTDKIEALAAKAEKFWHKRFTPKGEELDLEEKIDLLLAAFTAWQEQFGLLANKMKLMLTPMDGDALWQYLDQKFNGKNCPPSHLPHWIKLNYKGELTQEHYREHSNKDLGHKVAIQHGYETHMTSLLLGEKLPIYGHGEFTLPYRNCHVGVLKFHEAPDGWAADPAGSRWFWDEVIAREEVIDVEIVTQFGWANSENSLDRLQKYTKQHLGTSAAAKAKNNAAVSSTLNASEAELAQISLLQGDDPVYVACVIVVYAKTPAGLDSTLRFIKNRFRRPAKVERDLDYPWRTWLQTLPLRWEMLCAEPVDFRMRLRTSDAVNFIQGVTTRSRGKRGAEFIAEQGGAPIYVSLEDGMGSPRHGVVTGRSGSGKSVKVAGAFLIPSMAQGMTITIVDLPKGNGTSTYKWLVKFLGGVEFDPGQNSNNLLELIDVRHLPEEIQEERLQSFYKNTINVVLSLILDNRRESEALPINAIESIVTMGVTQFYADPVIRRRCEAALARGIGTSGWQDWPVLEDLLGFFSKERLNLLDFGTEVDRALNYIKLRLRYWLSSPFGKAICRPSGFDGRQSRLKLFSLRDLSSDEEAGILGASAQVVATRSALSAPRSLFYIDEASVLLNFNELAKSAGILHATGRGAGMSIVMATQDPNILANCSASSQILQNQSFRITGKVAAAAIPSYERIFQYPRHIIAPNAEDGFTPSLQGTFSRWLVDDDNLITPCRYYPSYNLLGITANNRPEIESRQRFFDEYSDKYEALGRYSCHLVDCNRIGRKL